MNIMKKFTLILAFAMMMTNALMAQKEKKPNINTALKSMQNGNLAEAMSEIDRASEYEKIMDNGKTWYYRGLIYAAIDTSSTEGGLSSEAFDIAMKSFAKAEELNKGGSEYYLMESNGFPVTKTQQLENLWSYYYNTGLEIMNDDADMEVALNKFKKCVALQPDNMISHYLLGLAYYRLEQVDGAISHFNTYLDLEKKTEDKSVINDDITQDIYSMVIRITGVDLEDMEKALMIIQEAKSRFPGNTEYPKKEIDYLIQLDKVDEAKASIINAIKEEPDNANLHFSLGVMYDNLEQVDSARISYEKAIAIDSTHLSAQFNLAVDLFNEAVHLISEKNNLGISASDLKKAESMQKDIDAKLKESLPHWEKVHELDPKDKTALEQLKYTYFQMKMGDKAEEMQSKLEALGYTEE